MNTEKTYYKFWLSSVESLRLAPNKTRNLLDIYGDAESVYKSQRRRNQENKRYDGSNSKRSR